ncbi:MAG: aldehyde ferredoxin oxidoreductase family protein [Thermoplasmata archaeon]|nr:aldehyde ferredoxin oxidoreductase family protein [Thermoplasmata archaeon]
MYGWHGLLLRVNLTHRKFSIEPVSEKVLHSFLGGRGLGAAIAQDELKSGIAPLSEENKLIFCTGPLTATGVPTSSRFTCTAISPLTGTLFDSNCGGTFGIQLKRSGIDGLIVEGVAEKPVVLYLEKGKAEIVDAEALWGKTTEQVFDTLEKKGKVLCIGPAGENLVRFANIQSSGYHALGRGGLGAVMGSKKLKAIVCKGNLSVGVKDREKLRFFVNEMMKWLSASPITSKALPHLGTAGLVNLINEYGMLPAQQWTAGSDQRAEQVSGEALRNYFVKHESCRACPIGCGRISCADGMIVKGPEYESIWALGINCGIFDLKTIIAANRLCNLYGMDTISAGATVAAAMGLHGKNAELNTGFGDGKGLVEMLEKIAYRRGIGNELAEGSERFCQIHGAESFTVKGLELPAYDPRGAFGLGLAYATANRGGCHLKGYMIAPEILGIPRFFNRFSESDKPDIVARVQNTAAVIDSLVLCLFTNLAVSEGYYARLLSAVTGIDYRAEDLQVIGERIWNLERLWNLRAGRAVDTLPERLLKVPLDAGNSAGRTVPLETMLRKYYLVRGWDEKGVPKREKLRELGIG